MNRLIDYDIYFVYPLAIMFSCPFLSICQKIIRRTFHLCVKSAKTPSPPTPSILTNPNFSNCATLSGSFSIPRSPTPAYPPSCDGSKNHGEHRGHRESNISLCSLRPLWLIMDDARPQQKLFAISPPVQMQPHNIVF